MRRIPEDCRAFPTTRRSCRVGSSCYSAIWPTSMTRCDPCKNYWPAANRPDELLGGYVMGPKFGEFLNNQQGIRGGLTKDMWFTRTWNRYFGELIGKDGLIVDQPTPKQRILMDGAAGKVAAELGIEVADLQAVLWYNEQQLYKKLGVRVESYSFKDGAERLAERLGRSELVGRTGDDGARQATERIRADAVSRALGSGHQTGRTIVSPTQKLAQSATHDGWAPCSHWGLGNAVLWSPGHSRSARSSPRLPCSAWRRSRHRPPSSLKRPCVSRT